MEGGRLLAEPSDWDLDDLLGALRDGAARPVRLLRGRVTDEEHDPLSAALDGCAAEVDGALRLHWMVSDSPNPLLQAPEGSPRPSLETLVELQAAADQLRRLAARLRAEGL